ncbi:MAG: hypothetical protein COV45_00300 [Deltaproteobacteria bacterium CG11_big_fil_rev_8_21_14_0_20_47_16]|nr:MAG: hypothetical protein COV45_00300 [Deltaproteobacteria bacterium CG11_big_fil_rev_8_21_14_0_20_47_16]
MMRRLLFIVLPLVACISLSVVNPPALRWLESKSLDWRFLWRGPIKPTGDIVVVAIDDKSVSHVGRWPWPRETVAQLVTKLANAHPKTIALDIIFSEASIGDDLLSQAVNRAGNVALGYYFYQTPQEVAAADFSQKVLDKSFETILPVALPDLGASQLIAASGIVATIPELAASAATQGYINAFPDHDGVLRHVPLVLRYRNHVFPSMALNALSRQQGGFAPVVTSKENGVVGGIVVGKQIIPTSPLGEVLINYRGGSEMFKVVSAADVLTGQVAPDVLANKTVLVGATAVGIYDLRVTPISPNMPGVVVGANLLDMLYKGDLLRQGSVTQYWNLSMLVLLAIVLGSILLSTRLLLGVAISLVVMIVYAWSAQLWFKQGYVVALAMPLLECVILTAIVIVYRGLTEERQKRQIRRAFRAYLHPSVVAELTEHPENLKLGGQRKNCTILFCDVKNFSTISENMAPEKLTQLMNTFFDPICQAVMAEGGYVDKLIGDAVMAVFGAPLPMADHAVRACRSAITIQQKANDLAPRIQREFGVAEFKLRIGVHTGPVVVGNMGTRDRLNYTVMGDVVNLASRLEGANKELGTDILLSEATAEAAGAEIQSRYVDTIQVKGKTEFVKVYTVSWTLPLAEVKVTA